MCSPLRPFWAPPVSPGRVESDVSRRDQTREGLKDAEGVGCVAAGTPESVPEPRGVRAWGTRSGVRRNPGSGDLWSRHHRHRDTGRPLLRQGARGRRTVFTGGPFSRKDHPVFIPVAVVLCVPTPPDHQSRSTGSGTSRGDPGHPVGGLSHDTAGGSSVVDTGVRARTEGS